MSNRAWWPRARWVVTAAMAGCALLVASCGGAGDGATQRTSTAPGEQVSLVLITLDTLRADRLGSYGYAPAETPVLD
ncbi:MAG: hypothetical protein SF066_22645, partial [Thermoanaerobaculia bacterium]|nr:hypothetical protein [Thermoanaerobaculia bacterium]